MLLKYTPQELEEMEKLEKKYGSELDCLNEQHTRLSIHYNWPDTDKYFKGIDAIKNPQKWKEANEREFKAIETWMKNPPPEWSELTDKIDKLHIELETARQEFIRKVERRQFAELGGDPDRILADGKTQADEIILAIYTSRKETFKQGTGWAFDVVALGGSKWKLDATETRSSITRGLHLHFDALKNRPAMLEELNTFIKKAVSESPHVAPDGTPGRGGMVIVPMRSKDVGAVAINLRLHGERETAGRAAPTLPGYDRVPFSSAVYYPLGQMANLSKPFSPASKGTKVTRRRDAYGNQITLFDSKEAVVSLIHKGLDKVSETAQQLFIYGFIVGERQGWRGNTARLTINEFMEYLGEDKNKNSWDYCVKKIDAALSELASHVMTITYKDKPGQNKKRDIVANTPIVQKTIRERFTGQIELLYDEGILSAARTYFAILPEWSGRVKEFNGQRLSWLIYYRMNTAKSGSVNINNRDILEWLGLPTKKEEVKGRKYSREMVDPVLKAFESIEEAAGNSLKIRPSDDGSIDTFLSGFTQFEADKDAALHYKSIREKINNRKTKELKAAEKGKLKAIEKNSEALERDP